MNDAIIGQALTWQAAKDAAYADFLSWRFYDMEVTTLQERYDYEADEHKQVVSVLRYSIRCASASEALRDALKHMTPRDSVRIVKVK